MLETSKFRNKYYDDLFLFWANKKPVNKVSQARWLKTVLSLSGIDAKVFSDHLYRGTTLSSAHNKGVSLNDIL